MTLRHASSDDAHAHTGEVRDAKSDILESHLECARKGRGVLALERCAEKPSARLGILARMYASGGRGFCSGDRVVAIPC